MPRSRLILTTCIAAILALVAAGCGLLADPRFTTEDEVLEALLQLQDGAEYRATAELTVDEGEVRDALRDDPAALELLRDAVGEDEGDVDELLQQLEDAQAMLADHAVLLARGADGSVRVAAEYQGQAWADLRAGSDLEPGADPADGVDIDLQLQVDWPTAATVFEQPDLLDELDMATDELSMFLGDAPELDVVQRLARAFLAGELVGISGTIGPELFEGLGLPVDDLPGAAPDGLFGLTMEGPDARAVAETAFSFSGYRRDGEATLVDVTLELRAAADLVLDRLEEAPEQAGLGPEDIAAARVELQALPEQLTDVAVLRFGGDGILQQVRVDLLDVLLQVGRAADPGDEDVATLERLAGELDATGLFAVLDVTGVGTTKTVLGDPSTTASPEELAAAASALLLPMLGGTDALLEELSAGADELSLDEFPAGLGAFGGLSPEEIAVGDCFDDAALLGALAEGADPTVDCAQPHDNEAFAEVTVDASSWEELVTQRPDADACTARFEDFVGTPYLESELLVDVLPPRSDQFEAGARTSICFLYGFEPITGSAAGSGR